MTGTSPEDLGRLGDSRYKLFKDYLWGSTNAEFQQQLTNKAFTASIKILNPKNPPPPYHPAVRFNAVLDSGHAGSAVRRGRFTSAGAAAAGEQGADGDRRLSHDERPLRAAGDPGRDDWLGAHAQLRQSLAADDVDKMAAALLKLINHDKPIQDMDPAAYAWLRLRAASVLSHFGTVGTNNSIHNALVKLAGDLKSMDDRCAAAALVAKIDYKQVKLEDRGGQRAAVEAGARSGGRGSEAGQRISAAGNRSWRHDRRRRGAAVHIPAAAADILVALGGVVMAPRATCLRSRSVFRGGMCWRDLPI